MNNTSPPSAALAGAVITALLALAVLGLAGHAVWLHSRLGPVKESRERPTGAPSQDEALRRVAALEARLLAQGPGAAAPAPAAPEAGPRQGDVAPPAAKAAPGTAGSDAAILERLRRLEAAVLQGLGYSFDRTPGPAVVEALIGRQFESPATRHRHEAAYSPGQVVGPPDSLAGSTSQTAWCSLEPDAGFEWIEVHFEKREVPRAVLVRESAAPGAVVQVEAEDASGQYRVVWTGEPNPGRRPGDFVIAMPPDASPTRALRITLDCAAVPGWNEIDAVGLIADGGILWAGSAAASSIWSGQPDGAAGR